MIVAIHQPNFAPWLGYFHKMRQADVFVLLDDADFSKHGYTNRVRVSQDKWMSVPVHAHLGMPINEVRLADTSIAERHLGILRANYGEQVVIDQFTDVERLACAASDRLVELNMAILNYLRGRLGVRTRLIRSSEMSVRGTATGRLVAIVKELGGDAYLSGSGAKNYQIEADFTNAGIDLVFSQFALRGDPASQRLSAIHYLCSAAHDARTVADQW